jgi:uncharacterized protein YicC (UPF0701 family)
MDNSAITRQDLNKGLEHNGSKLSKQIKSTKDKLMSHIKTTEDRMMDRMSEMSDAIINGMDRIFKEERVYNTATFTNKNDLKREVTWLRDDIKDLEGELPTKPGRNQFDELKKRVYKHLPN